MDSVVRRTLRVPIRKLSSCVLRMKEKGELALRRRRAGGRRRSRGGGSERRGGGAGRRCPARRTSNNLRKEPTVSYSYSYSYSYSHSYSYQAELEKERKLREDMNARKNAERAAMRGHFRRKYQLDKNQKDTEHLRSVGGKVTLPRELSKLVRGPPRSLQCKDRGFNLLSAFQSLSFSNKTSTPSPTPTPTRKAM